MRMLSALFLLAFWIAVASSQACDLTESSGCSTSENGPCPGDNCWFDCSSRGWTQLPCASSLPSTILTLWLNNNQFSVLPYDMFSGLVTVTGGLDLNNNFITSIETGAFINVVGVIQLGLSDNLISEVVPNMFSGLTLNAAGFTGLFLNGNPITYIASGAFNHVGGLRQLDFDNVATSLGISAGAFKGLDLLEDFSLANNPDMTIASDAFTDITTLTSFTCGEGTETCSTSTCFNTCGPSELCSVSGLWTQDSSISCALDTRDFTCRSPCHTHRACLANDWCGCKEAKLGRFCSKDCPPNRYGPACLHYYKCVPGCAQDGCTADGCVACKGNFAAPKCETCADGWAGAHCHQPVSTTSTTTIISTTTTTSSTTTTSTTSTTSTTTTTTLSVSITASCSVDADCHDDVNFGLNFACKNSVCIECSKDCPSAENAYTYCRLFFSSDFNCDTISCNSDGDCYNSREAGTSTFCGSDNTCYTCSTSCGSDAVCVGTGNRNDGITSSCMSLTPSSSTTAPGSTSSTIILP